MRGQVEGAGLIAPDNSRRLGSDSGQRHSEARSPREAAAARDRENYRASTKWFLVVESKPGERLQHRLWRLLPRMFIRAKCPYNQRDLFLTFAMAFVPAAKVRRETAADL